jgi:Protein kinase domain
MPRGKLSRWVSRLKGIFKQSKSESIQQHTPNSRANSHAIFTNPPIVPVKKPPQSQSNSDSIQQQPSKSSARNLPKDLEADPSNPLPTIQSSTLDGGNSVHVSNDPLPWRTSTDALQPAAARPISGASAENSHLIGTRQSQVSPRADFLIIPIYDGKEHPQPHMCRLGWMEPRCFSGVNNAALRLVREYHKVPEATQLYRKSGSCRLINNETHEVEESRIVENERQWAEAIPQMVMEHFRKSTYDKFHLEIRWEYSALSISVVKGERYATTVQTVVHKKLVMNWEDEKYIPRRDLDEIYRESTIKTLVEADESIDRLLLSADDANEFLEQINLHATRLLAICIHIDMPLACLYRLVERNYKDENLPLSRKESHCPLEEYEFKFESFMKWQGAFVAHTFVNDKGGPKHMLLADNVVLPITFDKTEPSLGHGGFGDVKKVYIHSDHHYFSSDRNAPLALKIFFRHPRTQADFGKEEQALQALSEFPHPNITLHLASWTLKGVFYMLFPCAEMNLHQFLRCPPCDFDTEFVRWLLWQLRGLADGVRHIHNLGPSRLVVGTQNLSTPGPQAQRKRSGYHHDIKPKNILVFAKDKVGGEKPKMTDFIFKLSDFGAAKINIILSRSGDLSHHTDAFIVGDPVYRAPDQEIDGVTSRPYDIWSLGCVFLEVLVWIFHLGGDESVDNFEVERLQSASQFQSCAFWHRNDKGRIVLKSSVVKHLQQLRTCGENHTIFKRFVRSIGKMLVIKPSERVTAAEVFNVLDAAYMQAEYDVRNQPDIYQRNMVGYQRVAESPTTFFDEGSRQPSIDQRSFGSFHIRENEGPRTHQSAPQILSSSFHGFGNGDTSPEGRLSTTNSDPLQLSPLHTQNLPPRRNHSRSPSIISVSHHDYPEVVEQCIFNAAHDDFPEPFPPVGSHMDPVRREDFVTVGPRRRTRTGESQSI